MNIKIKATNLHLSDPIKKYTEEKINSLEKFQDDLQLARVELEMRAEKHTGEKFRAEITIDAPHRVYRAESLATDLYAAIDGLVPKLNHQIEKEKTITIKKSRSQRRIEKTSQQELE